MGAKFREAMPFVSTAVLNTCTAHLSIKYYRVLGGMTIEMFMTHLQLNQHAK